MHPDIAHMLAQAHLDDLRREAARHRLARQIGRSSRRTSAPRWQDAMASAGRRLRAATVPERDPACCPA